MGSAIAIEKVRTPWWTVVQLHQSIVPHLGSVAPKKGQSAARLPTRADRSFDGRALLDDIRCIGLALDTHVALAATYCE